MQNIDEQLINEFKAHNRRALSKIITKVESNFLSYNDSLLSLLKNLPIKKKLSIRLAISGPPGVGKSTFINALGKQVLQKNFKLAVLAIDPASEISKGSILADKTRMSDLINHENAYIRPTSSKGMLGGVTLQTFDVMRVLESFGFDFIIIETLGVGQSEAMAWSCCDHFLLLMQPGSGDQLQAMKRGVLERADSILINKADGDLISLAHTAHDTLKTLLQKEENKDTYIKSVSAKTDNGIKEYLDYLLAAQAQLSEEDVKNLRECRLKKFFDFAFEQLLMLRIKKKDYIKSTKGSAIKEIAANRSYSYPKLTMLVDNILNN